MPFWNYLRPIYQPIIGGVKRLGGALDDLDERAGALASGRTPGFNPAADLPMGNARPRRELPPEDENPLGNLFALRVPPMQEGKPVSARPRVATPPATDIEESAEPPRATRPRFADPYNAARSEYVGQHARRGFKEILKGGLAGMAMSGGEGGPGGLLGGFAGGALGQAVNPTGMAQARFQMGEGSRILEDQQRRRADEMYRLKTASERAEIERRQKAADAADRQHGHFKTDNGTIDTRTGKIIPGTARPAVPRAQRMIEVEDLQGNYQGMVNENDPNVDWARLRKVPPRSPEFMNSPPGGAIFNTKQGKAVFQNPRQAPPASPTEQRAQLKAQINAELDQDPNEGRVADIAESSLRGRQEDILSRLSQRERALLLEEQGGPAAPRLPVANDTNGKPILQSEAEVAEEKQQAVARYNTFIKQEQEKVLKETQAARDAKVEAEVVKRMQSGTGTGARSQNQPTRKLSELRNKHGL